MTSPWSSSPPELDRPPVAAETSPLERAPGTPHRPGPPVSPLALEAELFTLLDRQRARHHLQPLTLDPLAVRVARAHSRDMCQRQYFDHRSADGSQPWDRLREAGVPFRAAAENIAKGHRSAAEVHAGWQASPEHRQNRLNPRYRRVGIGVFRCGGGQLFWTEVFFR